MATEYISRESAIETVLEKPDMTPDEKAGIVARLNALPAADLQPAVKSRWIEIDDYVLCSNCGVAEHSPNRNYCHGCGADMRKVVEIDQVKEADT